ncbi:MAG: hypothetical protein DWI21_17435 [Planctomycetota bacterium]|nr:MAG: hypothetical protein DWI21_17435 [Planctomycetota bacterium]GDY07287.1 hypothetical protein LBMAG52_07730 [Planctomycetia bacterium]
MIKWNLLSIVIPKTFSMPDLPLSNESPPDRASTSATPAAMLAYGAAGIYLSVPVSLIFDEVIFKTYHLSRAFPQLQNPVRILYFPFMWVGYWLGLIPWSPPTF